MSENKPFDKYRFESFEALAAYALSIRDLLQKYKPDAAGIPEVCSKKTEKLPRRKWRLGE